MKARKIKLTFVMWSGTWHLGHAAKSMLRMKNGLQQRTNVKKTSPRTWKIELGSLVTIFTLSLINLLWLLSARWLQRSPTNSVAFAGLKSSI
jgi:hypothetical protein